MSAPAVRTFATIVGASVAITGTALGQPAPPTPTPSGAATASAGGFPAPGAVSPSPIPTAPAAPSASSPTAAYDARAKALDDSIDELLTIPETPAAFSVGLSTEKVAHPGDLRDATAQLASALGPGGKILPGLAVEVAPFRSLYAKLTVDEWRKNTGFFSRALDSVRVSLVTSADPAAKGAADAPPLIAGGLRLSLLNDRDYRRNSEFLDAARSALVECFPSQPQTPTGQGGAAFTTVPEPPSCKKLDGLISNDLPAKFLKTGHRLELAAAVVVADRSITAGGADWRSTRTWLAYDYGLQGVTLGAAGDVAWRDNLQGNTQTDVRAGGRLQLDGSTLTWSVGAAYARLEASLNAPKNALETGTALSFKVGRLVVVRGGAQLTRDYDAKTTDVSGLVMVSTATGETLFAKVLGNSGAGH